MKITLLQFPRRVNLALSGLSKEQACLAHTLMRAQGQTGHSEKAEIRSNKSAAYTFIPRDISNIFVSNLSTRSNGGCVAQVSSINESTSNIRGVRRPPHVRPRQPNKHVWFFSIFHSFRGSCKYFYCERRLQHL